MRFTRKQILSRAGRLVGALLILLALLQAFFPAGPDAEPISEELNDGPSEAALPLEIVALELPPPPTSPPAGEQWEEAPTAQEPTVELVAAARQQAQVDHVRRQEPQERRQAQPKPSVPEPASASVAEAAMRIAWPNDPQARIELDAFLHDCVGMRNGILATNGRLLAWEDDVDPRRLHTFSELLRAPEGELPPAERSRLQQLGWPGRAGQPVRLFPRSFDITLLGHLQRSVGELQGSGWRARYELEHDRLFLLLWPEAGATPQRWVLAERSGCALAVEGPVG